MDVIFFHESPWVDGAIGSTSSSISSSSSMRASEDFTGNTEAGGVGGVGAGGLF